MNQNTPRLGGSRPSYGENFSFALLSDCLLPVLYLGIFSSGIAYTLQMLGQKNCRRPQVASLIMSLESVIATLSGFLFLHQKLTAMELTGCALMCAIDRGLLSMDDPVEKYVPEFRDVSWLDVGARCIEVSSGMKFEDFVRTNILNPLGMTSSGFWPTDAQLDGKIEMYDVKGGETAKWRLQADWMQRPYNDDRVFSSAGAGLWTTVRDQLKFYKMLMNLGVGDNGARILKSETVKEVLGRSSRPKELGAYSLGFWCDDHGWIGHGGAWGTDAKINWKEKKLVLWVVQLGSGPRPWEKDAGAARDRFFNRRIDDSASSAYTGRLK